MAYAMTAEILGYSFIYLEAGSRAPHPISSKVIRAIRETIHIGIMVGGGIVTKENAKDAVEAGADIIVIGTHFERNESIHDIIDIIHSTQRYNPRV